MLNDNLEKRNQKITEFSCESSTKEAFPTQDALIAKREAVGENGNGYVTEWLTDGATGISTLDYFSVKIFSSMAANGISKDLQKEAARRAVALADELLDALAERKLYGSNYGT